MSTESMVTQAAGGRNEGHGHVLTRPDGAKARCGGPALCRECARDLAVLQQVVSHRTAAQPEREAVEFQDRAYELLATAYEGEGRPITADDLRNRNVGSQGVRWVRTECAISAITAALTAPAPAEGDDLTDEQWAKVLDNAPKPNGPLTPIAPAVSRDALCEDCPPVGYPTDKTRCAPCPRRVSTDEIEAVLEAGDKLADVARRYGGAPGREAIAAWKAAILSRIRGEGE